jgi:DNA invertase Pin-like site-specific DNA recombinase
MMKTAYSYIRFSTPEQAMGDSERRQLALAEAYCARNGLKLSTEHIRLSWKTS